MSASVVPARAGMSPTIIGYAIVTSCGPRASGDEPLCPRVGDELVWWSPRERG